MFLYRSNDVIAPVNDWQVWIIFYCDFHDGALSQRMASPASSTQLATMHPSLLIIQH
jgi:hypothetical protein